MKVDTHTYVRLLVNACLVLSIRVGASIQEQPNHLQMTIPSGEDQGGFSTPLLEKEPDKKRQVIMIGPSGAQGDAYIVLNIRVGASVQEQLNHLQTSILSGEEKRFVHML